MPVAVIEDVAQNSRINYLSEPLHPSTPSPENTPTNDGISLRNYLQSNLYRQKQRRLDEKINRLINYGYDQEARRRTTPQEMGFRGIDYSQVDDEFKTATITSEALRKGNYISRRMGGIVERPLEVYLYSLDNQTPSNGLQRAIRDLYIAKDQEVTATKCDVNDPILSKLDIRDNLKKRIIGWSHSHGALNNFFSYGRGGEMTDEEGTAAILETSGLKKRIRIFDNSIRGEGYKGVEYEVKYTPAIVFNAENAQPFVAVGVEYTRRYDGQKIFHINEHCKLGVIEETNGIDMDPASIDRQILERVFHNGRRLDEIAGRRYRAEPKGGVITEAPLTERIVEEIYNQFNERYNTLDERIRRIEIRDERLRKVYKGLRFRYKTLIKEHEQTNQRLKKVEESGLTNIKKKLKSLCDFLNKEII